MKKTERQITECNIEKYLYHLHEQERSDQTIKKYHRDLLLLHHHLDGRLLQKTILIEWKSNLTERYASSSVNSMLASLNGFLRFMGWDDLKIRPLKIQRAVFLSPEKELKHSEYQRLIAAAKTKGNDRLSLIIQTICATGIRVSELKYITVESIKNNRAEVYCKGKQRTVFLPKKLSLLLRNYTHRIKKTSGAIFTTRCGKVIDRSNIWRDMKSLCSLAGVNAEKVFPHNLRHLFARTYYSIEKDVLRLADILGHSNVSTTRIYTMESGRTHARQLDRMRLIIT